MEVSRGFGYQVIWVDGDDETEEIMRRSGWFVVVVGMAVWMGCTGEPGLTGDQGDSVLVESEAASPEACPHGGTTLIFGYDRQGDGVIDEVVTSHDVCDGGPGDRGPEGSDGRELLVETSTAAQNLCPAGGTRILMGYDNNGDGAIDEVQAQYTICSGEAGEDGTPLLVASELADEEDCPGGGLSLIFGYDTDGDDEIDDVVSTEVICDGVDGQPLLVEEQGCLEGLRLVFGYDTDGDGELDETVHVADYCEVEAPSVVFFADGNEGENAIEAGLVELASQGRIELSVPASRSEMNDEIEAGDHDVVVFLAQNVQFSGTEVGRLIDWVEDGGRLIAVNWTANSLLAEALESDYAGGTDQGEASFVDGRFFQGLPVPLVLTNPGWSNAFARDLEPAGDGVSVCAFGNGTSCAVLGNEERTLHLGFLGDTVDVTHGPQMVRNFLTVLMRAPDGE